MILYKRKEIKKIKDERGVITDLPLDLVINSVMVITGKKGAVRGAHYHEKDQHYAYVLSGKILYEYNYKHRDFHEDEKGFKEAKTHFVLLEAGDLVLSQKNELHRFKFLSDGVFLALATEARTQESYESDTHREDF